MKAWERYPDARPHLTPSEVRDLVARHDAGETYHAIAKSVDRHHATVTRAIRGWRAGTSRAAYRAKQMGIYP